MQKSIGKFDFYLSKERDGEHIRVVGIKGDINFSEACRSLKQKADIEKINLSFSDYEKMFDTLCEGIYEKIT